MNKKIIAVLAASCTLGGIASAQIDTADFSLSSTVGFESEYVFRGIQQAPGSMQVSVEANVAGFYAGVWANQPVFDDFFGKYDNQVNLYIGYSASVSELVEIDVGGTYYTYPESTGRKNTQEVYAGMIFDVLLTPSVYLYYDFELENFTAEVAAGYTFDLVDIAPGTSFELGGNLGYVDVKNGKDYTFAGATADLKYSFTDNASLSVGARLSKNTVTRTPAFNRSNLWWGISFTAGF